MKIETDILLKFFRQSTLRCTAEMCILDFAKRGLRIRLIHDRSIVIDGFLPREVFSEYDPIGLCGIRDTNRLDRFLSTHGKVIKIKRNSYQLILRSKFQITRYTLCDVKYVETRLEKMPDYIKKFKSFHDLERKFIKGVLDSVHAIGDEAIIIGERKSWAGFSVSDSQDMSNALYPGIKLEKGFKVKYGPSLIRVLKSTTGNLQIGFAKADKKRTPAMIIDKDSKYRVRYCVGNKPLRK